MFNDLLGYLQNYASFFNTKNLSSPEDSELTVRELNSLTFYMIAHMRKVSKSLKSSFFAVVYKGHVLVHRERIRRMESKLGNLKKKISCINGKHSLLETDICNKNNRIKGQSNRTACFAYNRPYILY